MGNESVIPLHYLNAVVTGDARVLAEALPDNSIDLIVTDPVYANMADYEWLSHTAMRVLKPNSACLTYCAIGLLPETHDAMRAGGLRYRWRLITRPINSKEFCGRLLITTQECLWYEKGRSTPLQSIFDFDLSASKGQHGVNGSNWGKGRDILERYIATFAEVGALVFDPFSGSGSVPAVCKMLGRRYIAFEIDPTTADNARQRIFNTQPPLPLVYDNQLTFNLDT